MKPDRWKEIEKLYQVCISLPQNERARFLAGASADEEIRREVETLLAQHENPPSFLERRGLDVAADMITQSQLRTLLGRTLAPTKSGHSSEPEGWATSISRRTVVSVERSL